MHGGGSGNAHTVLLDRGHLTKGIFLIYHIMKEYQVSKETAQLVEAYKEVNAIYSKCYEVMERIYSAPAVEETMSDTLEKTTELCNSILDLIKLTIY